MCLTVTKNNRTLHCMHRIIHKKKNRSIQISCCSSLLGIGLALGRGSQKMLVGHLGWIGKKRISIVEEKVLMNNLLLPPS